MWILGATVLASVADPAAVFAYVDPSAGGLLMQVLLAGFGGALVVFRIAGRRFLNRFKRQRPDA